MNRNHWESNLNNKLVSATGVSLNDLSTLEKTSDSVCINVIAFLLEYACQSQHVSNITATREAISLIPKNILLKHLNDSIDRALDLNDEWEYRRLLELTPTVGSEHMRNYIQLGLESQNPEVREAAQDFSESMNK